MSNDDGSTWANRETLGALQSVNAWTPVGFNLETVRALTSQMKVRVRSADGTLVDTIVESAIDDVRVLGAQICSGIVPEAPGDTAPGSLRIDKEGSNLRLRWGADCGGGNGYGLYRGDLFAGYDSIAPVPGFCGVGATSAVLDPGPESYFFLVTPNDGACEGCLGRLDRDSERLHQVEAGTERADVPEIPRPG